MKAGRWGVCGGLKFCYLAGNGCVSRGDIRDGDIRDGDISRGVIRDGDISHGSVVAEKCPGTADAPLNRIMISVPKRFFKRAVKRNLLKRRLRESYRRQKHILESTGCGIDILFQYNTSDILSYDYIYALMGKILGEIASRS